MSILLPIIHLPNKAARHKLVEDLYAIGIKRVNCHTPESAKDEMTESCPYVYLDIYIGTMSIYRTGFGTFIYMTKYPATKTLVNSPAHFLAYTKRLLKT